MPLKLKTFQIGAPAKRGDGLRIGTVRLPPRGVPRNRWQADGYFDVWYPVVAPSRKLLRWARSRNTDNPVVFRAFLHAYERELLAHAESRQAIHLLAEMAKRTTISIGCHCPVDMPSCHRSRLKELIERAATGELL